MWGIMAYFAVVALALLFFAAAQKTSEDIG